MRYSHDNTQMKESAISTIKRSFFKTGTNGFVCIVTLKYLIGQPFESAFAKQIFCDYGTKLL
jgi:hypothetical protein